MGDRRKRPLSVQFDGKLKLEFHGTKITSDAGLLAFRELDEAFRLTEKASIMLSESRQGKNTQHTMLAMLRQAIYGRLAGYEDVNDAERLRVDPAMRRVVGGRATEKEAASTSEMSRFETEMLSSMKNMTISARRKLLLRHGAGKRSRSTLARERGQIWRSRTDICRQHGPSVLRLGQDFDTMTAFEAANGKSPLISSLTVPPACNGRTELL